MTAIDDHQVGQGVWKPYEDFPLLTPPMLLGFEACGSADQERLLRYLAALVAVRRAPVHVNVAFNAVYFGYDVATLGYVGALELFELPRIKANEEVEALPVGAMVEIDANWAPLFAEVVYKEGAYPGLGEDGDVPAWLAGAPAGAFGPGLVDVDAQPVLHERLVVDFDAFGPGLCATPTQLDRLRRKHRGMDADGHLLVRSSYPGRSAAGLDDVAFYARYLVKRGRAQLLNAGAPKPLRGLLSDEAGDEHLESAVLGLLGTIREAFNRLGDDLRVWNGYAFTRDSLARRLADNGPLGGGDLETLATQMAKAAIPTRPRKWADDRTVAYTAVGPALRNVHGASALLGGLDYARAVCHANAVVADYAGREADEHGLLENRVHLRLDDPWQGGGIWRAEYPGSSYSQVVFDEPLGLGWLGSQPRAQEAPTAAPDLVAIAEVRLDEPGPEVMVESHQPENVLPEQLRYPDESGDPLDESDLTDIQITDSILSWTQVLRLAHLVEGRLPIPAKIAAQMHNSQLSGQRLRLELTHDGCRLDPQEATQTALADLYAERPNLVEIMWPFEIGVSMVLSCSWRRHGWTVRATTTLLDEPVSVGDDVFEHRFSLPVHTRDAFSGARPSRTPETAGPTLTSARLVLKAVRRLGLLSPDGCAVLAGSHLTRAVYGRDGQPGGQTALDKAVAELVADGLLREDVGGIDAQRRLTYPAAPTEPTIPVLVYEPTVTSAAAGPVRRKQNGIDQRYVRHTAIHGHLRKIGHLGWHPSDDAKAAYSEYCRQLGLPQRDLPKGFTFRREG